MFRRGPTDLADGSGVAATLGCRDHRVCGDVLGRGAVARFPVDYVPELGARNMKKKRTTVDSRPETCGQLDLGAGKKGMSILGVAATSRRSCNLGLGYQRS